MVVADEDGTASGSASSCARTLSRCRGQLGSDRRRVPRRQADSHPRYKLPTRRHVTLARLRRIDAAAQVVILTGHASIELAIQAIKAGAEHLLSKPVDLRALLALVRRVLRPRAPGAATPDPFTGESAAIGNLAAQAKLVAASDRPTLILGETGAGKGVLARWSTPTAGAPRGRSWISTAPGCRSTSSRASFSVRARRLHRRGGAQAGACRGAAGGALFLDEIASLERLQPKLLKAVEEKRIRRVATSRRWRSTSAHRRHQRRSANAVREGASAPTCTPPEHHGAHHPAAARARARHRLAGARLLARLAPEATLSAEALARSRPTTGRGTSASSAMCSNVPSCRRRRAPRRRGLLVAPAEGSAADSCRSTRWSPHIERAIAAADGRVDDAAACCRSRAARSTTSQALSSAIQKSDRLVQTWIVARRPRRASARRLTIASGAAGGPLLLCIAGEWTGPRASWWSTTSRRSGSRCTRS